MFGFPFFVLVFFALWVKEEMFFVVRCKFNDEIVYWKTVSLCSFDNLYGEHSIS